jgi:hypothetical protein
MKMEECTEGVAFVAATKLGEVTVCRHGTGYEVVVRPRQDNLIPKMSRLLSQSAGWNQPVPAEKDSFSIHVCNGLRETVLFAVAVIGRNIMAFRPRKQTPEWLICHIS